MIATGNGERQVLGETSGAFGVYLTEESSPPGWKVSHLRTGRSLTADRGFQTLEAAKEFAARIAPLADWESIDATHPPDISGQVEAIRNDLERSEILQQPIAITHDYPEPVARLLIYGKRERVAADGTWLDYRRLGLDDRHIPELIRMAGDDALNHAGPESAEVWAPLHAWRALGQLKAVEAVQPLLELFEDFSDDDWLHEELPRVFAMIGPTAIPMIADFLADTRIAPADRSTAPICLEKIAAAHPDRRDDCIGILVRQLEKHRANGADLSAWIVYSLIDLGAVEAIEAIRRAFNADCVDISLSGDLEEVEILLGLRQKRNTPRPRFVQLPGTFTLDKFSGDDEYAPPLPFRRETKVGRNDPCPCGSGNKFKKCCGS